MFNDDMGQVTNREQVEEVSILDQVWVTSPNAMDPIFIPIYFWMPKGPALTHFK